MKRFLINPPFGNYISHRYCTRVMGSFTLHKRPGLFKNVAKSLRPIEGGWVNRIGLRNPGIKNVTLDIDRIYSIVGMEPHDWEDILYFLMHDYSMPLHKKQEIEINLGCPNVHEYGIAPEILRDYCNKFTVGAKLSPIDNVYDVSDMCVDSGVCYLHLSNTIPTERGGESGNRLKKINLPIVEKIKAKHPGVTIVAGGGIYNIQDVLDYKMAGADCFGLATVWFNPFRATKLLRDYYSFSWRANRVIYGD